MIAIAQRKSNILQTSKCILQYSFFIDSLLYITYTKKLLYKWTDSLDINKIDSHAKIN